MDKPVGYEGIIKMLADNYRKVEQSVANQILLNVSNHYPTQGSYRENVWKSLFEMIVPKKYCIEQGVFIIDSYGNKSKEADLVIFDEMYTPYIFNYGEIKFIPIEAVTAVVQCKSNTVDYDEVTAWRESIEALFTSMDSVARMAQSMIDNSTAGEKSVTQTATRPIMIFCAIEPINWFSKLKKDFDVILSVYSKEKEPAQLHKFIRGEEKSLRDWNDSLNNALGELDCDSQEIITEKGQRIKKKREISGEKRKNFLRDLRVEQTDQGEKEENVLLSLIFQFNQLLMVLNNPMLFPHKAYADRFNKILNGFTKGEEDGQKK